MILGRGFVVVAYRYSIFRDGNEAFRRLAAIHFYTDQTGNQFDGYGRVIIRIRFCELSALHFGTVADDISVRACLRIDVATWMWGYKQVKGDAANGDRQYAYAGRVSLTVRYSAASDRLSRIVNYAVVAFVVRRVLDKADHVRYASFSFDRVVVLCNYLERVNRHAIISSGPNSVVVFGDVGASNGYAAICSG